MNQRNIFEQIIWAAEGIRCYPSIEGDPPPDFSSRSNLAQLIAGMTSEQYIEFIRRLRHERTTSKDEDCT
jgi:hypothetical protein